MRDFQQPGRSTVIATNGMCATSHPLAAKVAVQMLEAGGNAVDAAIAAGVLLGICEPQMTGIGGDCFALIKPGDSDDIVAINGSGRAPAGLSAEKLRAQGHAEMPQGSAHTVTVPGAIDAFCRMSAEHGRMGLKAVLAPAIHYAEAGVPVAARTAFDWVNGAENLQGAARDSYLANGQPLKVGQIFRSPGQAEALRLVAEHGRAGFYEGPVAQDMLAALRAAGGTHTEEDFARTEATVGTPVSGQYKGFELVEHPPNGQGATAILLANILAQFDVAAMDPMGADRLHLEAEATKLAYDARNRFIADPDHTERLDHLLDMGTAKKLAALIRMDSVLPDASAAAGGVHKDTVYLTVVDRDRMAVSLIYSIFRAFGSGIASERYGILFQNRGMGFTLQEGHPNEAGGGKRPMHTIIPGMLKRDGRLLMPFGVMGGAYQATGHARFLSNIADFGMEPQQAIDAPRAFAEQGILKVERGYSDAVRADLSARGHRVEVPEVAIGGAQAILIDDEGGTLHGASDPRKDGCALGY
ncbi:gamma-glutamyltransferase [Brevirhabdus pacifica]|uniref:Gamma-glutamyltransferase n=1 Tax=Brevirhabdus pacifica TaxID=1267768 RepID=A0A1U7DIA4_9RHOB|nr:gamma-glutamyltransferase family protein [Brevirhabdus pacifica]APX89724.1 gamma-glutamyltransferase [Brevirhabdus pacifica]OWU74562.1 gamma-glutamyltransferase [Loktanella sp. 22II-4b]PJJ85585.1 gamma-glutamyltransferase 2 [Brevirhabdus pacifica]